MQRNTFLRLEGHAQSCSTQERARELARRITRPEFGDESIIAVAMPVTILVAPGPDVAIATPTRPLARAKPSAI